MGGTLFAPDRFKTAGAGWVKSTAAWRTSMTRSHLLTQPSAGEMF